MGALRQLRRGLLTPIQRARPYVSHRSLSIQPPLSITLYQYTICPFCNRVKAVLDFAQLGYSVTEVNPLTKSEIRNFNHKKVPIATVEGQPIFGSDEIIQSLQAHEHVQKKLQERGGIALDEGSQWVDYSVNELAIYLYPNMCRSWSDSYKAFMYVRQTASFSPFQRFSIQTIGSLVSSL